MQARDAIELRRRTALALGGPVRRRDYLDAMAWNKAHPPGERLRAVAAEMRAALAPEAEPAPAIVAQDRVLQDCALRDRAA